MKPQSPMSLLFSHPAVRFTENQYIVKRTAILALASKVPLDFSVCACGAGFTAGWLYDLTGTPAAGTLDW